MKKAVLQGTLKKSNSLSLVCKFVFSRSLVQNFQENIFMGFSFKRNYIIKSSHFFLRKINNSLQEKTILYATTSYNVRIVNLYSPKVIWSYVKPVRNVKDLPNPWKNILINIYIFFSPMSSIISISYSSKGTYISNIVYRKGRERTSFDAGIHMRPQKNFISSYKSWALIRNLMNEK